MFTSMAKTDEFDKAFPYKEKLKLPRQIFKRIQTTAADADFFASAVFIFKKLSFAALLLQTLVYITHALHFRCNFVTHVDADFSSRYNKSPKAPWEIFF